MERIPDAIDDADEIKNDVSKRRDINGILDSTAEKLESSPDELNQAAMGAVCAGVGALIGAKFGGSKGGAVGAAVGGALGASLGHLAGKKIFKNGD